MPLESGGGCVRTRGPVHSVCGCGTMLCAVIARARPHAVMREPNLESKPRSPRQEPALCAKSGPPGRGCGRTLFASVFLESGCGSEKVNRFSVENGRFQRFQTGACVTCDVL